MTAVILAGGFGSRLKEHLQDLPKPLLQVNGTPVLERQIRQLKKYGLKKFILITGYKAEKIKAAFQDGTPIGVEIEYFVEPFPLGTAGAIAHLHKTLPEEFLLLYGDLVFDIDFHRFFHFHKSRRSCCTVMCHPNDHTSDSDLLELDDEQKVVGILKKNMPRTGLFANLANAGIAICHKSLFTHLQTNLKQDFEADVLLPAISRNEVLAYRTTEYLRDMGTPERLAIVSEHAKSGLIEKKNLSLPQKAIFLNCEETLFSPDTISAMRKINLSEYLCVGMVQCSEKRDQIETNLAHHNVYIDIYCTEIDNAAKKYNINLKNSFSVGNAAADVQAGQVAGMKAVLMTTNLLDTVADIIEGGIQCPV